MSNRALISRPIIGNFAYFLIAATTVEGVIVAPETVADPVSGKPDTSPPENWLSLGTVKDILPDVKADTFTYREAQPEGGFIEIEERNVVADYLTVELENMVDIAWQLMFGITTIETGTPQIPGNVMDRKVMGWLKWQARGTAGTDVFRTDQYCECRLAKMPEFRYAPVVCALRFQRRRSTLNTVNVL